MTGQKFWSGFVTGTAMGAFAGLAGVLLARRRYADIDNRVVRLEKSVNIGRPVQNVFTAWSDFERLPRWINFIGQVERNGTHTRWLVNMDGRKFEWEAQITQVVPNESIGWKSLNGPKHTGRITFSPLGNQTVVHVLMNYAPRMGGFGAFGSMLDQHLEQWIERGLREFKLALEREGGAGEPFERESRREFTSPGPGGFNSIRRGSPEPGDWEPVERTGTENVSTGPIGTPGKHSAPRTVGYTRPPEDK